MKILNQFEFCKEIEYDVKNVVLWEIRNNTFFLFIYFRVAVNAFNTESEVPADSLELIKVGTSWVSGQVFRIWIMNVFRDQTYHDEVVAYIFQRLLQTILSKHSFDDNMYLHEEHDLNTCAVLIQ